MRHRLITLALVAGAFVGSALATEAYTSAEAEARRGLLACALIREAGLEGVARKVNLAQTRYQCAVWRLTFREP